MTGCIRCSRCEIGARVPECTAPTCPGRWHPDRIQLDVPVHRPNVHRLVLPYTTAVVVYPVAIYLLGYLSGGGALSSLVTMPIVAALTIIALVASTRIGRRLRQWR